MKNLLILFAVLLFSGCFRDSRVQNENISFKELAGQKLVFQIKDNPSEFKPFEKYWITLKVGNMQKEKITITSNNGRVFNSELPDYDYMFVPEKIGKLQLRIYDRKENDGLCAEINIVIKKE